jgi:predicted lipoprotein with Yx(FWY)xxD motif
MMNVIRIGRAVVVGLCLLASGCDGDPAAAPHPPATATALPARVTGLFAIESRTFGSVVIDGQGFVLYRFDGDTADPPRSNCVDACAGRWPPSPTASDLRVTGIDRQLVGSITRADGTEQLTLDGWPLYGYTGDRMPGDATGQGADGAWSVIAPNGAKAGRRATPGG